MDRAPRFTPCQSRTIAPIPAEFLCLKRAALKFTITKSCSGGRHWCCTTGWIGGASDHWLLMKLWSRVQATELTFAIGRASRPKWRAFHLFHRLQEIIMNISGLNSSSTRINLLSKSLKLRWGGEIMDWNQWWVSHTGVTWLQKQRAWRASSGASLHSSQTSESAICLCFKLYFVGRASLHTLQTKCLILLGTYIFHNLFQKPLWLAWLLKLAQSEEATAANSL